MDDASQDEFLGDDLRVTTALMIGPSVRSATDPVLAQRLIESLDLFDDAHRAERCRTRTSPRPRCSVWNTSWICCCIWSRSHSTPSAGSGGGDAQWPRDCAASGHAAGGL